MKTKDLDLEYEFDMNDVMVACLTLTAAFLFLWWGLYIVKGVFSPAMGIPFILILVFYVLLDEHNDQTKARNDIRIAESLEANDYIQLTHKTAIKYV